jgi:hypothetical protein
MKGEATKKKKGCSLFRFSWFAPFLRPFCALFAPLVIRILPVFFSQFGCENAQEKKAEMDCFCLSGEQGTRRSDLGCIVAIGGRRTLDGPQLFQTNNNNNDR